MQTLNTKLCSLGLRRKNMDYDIDNIRLRIQQELDGPGCSGGYCAVCHTLKMEGIQVPRDIVRVVLKELDPQGVEERRSKTLRHRAYHTPGPNYSWHIDGYDKLKPSGFPVHRRLQSQGTVVKTFQNQQRPQPLLGNTFSMQLQNMEVVQRY